MVLAKVKLNGALSEGMGEFEAVGLRRERVAAPQLRQSDGVEGGAAQWCGMAALQRSHYPHPVPWTCPRTRGHPAATKRGAYGHKDGERRRAAAGLVSGACEPAAPGPRANALARQRPSHIKPSPEGDSGVSRLAHNAIKTPLA